MRLFLSLIAVAVISSGCATTAMKGTPFFTGEHAKREGDASDRVNLWPIAYYRNPALSVLWPIGEFSDDRFAIRPLFSMYRDGEDKPWHEWNWLGGLYSADDKNQSRAAFPFFWGRNYFNVFPLFWSGSDPGGSSHNILFPLWVYSQKGDETDIFCPWPIAGSFRDPEKHRYFVFPLWDRTRWPDHPERHADLFGVFLAGRVRGVTGGSKNWIFPLWYSEWCGVNNHEFYSLPWASKDNDWRSVPLLLSAWAPDGEWGRVLLGLGGWNGTSSWAFPLWYQDSATGEIIAPLCYRNPRTGVFVSPLWASKKDSWRAVPPLLSWWNGDGSGRALLGLAGWDDSRSWAIPFYYRDAASDTLATPLWAHQAGHWSAIPPLLSWRSADAATGDSSLFLLGGLAGATPDSHWLAPLYFRDEARDRFFSLPYASGRDWHAIPPLLTIWDRHQFISPLFIQHRSEGAIPPLLTWWDDQGLRVLLGLGGYGGSRDWAIPFYWRDTATDRFVSPVWAQGGEWNAVPPLLSAWRRDGRAGIVLLGLGGWFDDLRCDWCFPLWLAGGGDFYSLPYSKWTQHGTTYHSFATALAGWKEGREDGWWFLPFFGFTRYRDQVRYRYNWLLLGGGNVSPSESSHWFFPLWSHELRRATASGIASGEKESGAEEEDFSLLFLLYDYKRESVPADGHEYVRRRVLWRLYHHEELDGDETTDVFPAITWDRRKDGYRKFSFLWRLFRWERDPANGTSLDVLFIPIHRPQFRASEK